MWCVAYTWKVSENRNHRFVSSLFKTWIRIFRVGNFKRQFVCLKVKLLERCEICYRYHLSSWKVTEMNLQFSLNSIANSEISTFSFLTASYALSSIKKLKKYDETFNFQFVQFLQCWTFLINLQTSPSLEKIFHFTPKNCSNVWAVLRWERRSRMKSSLSFRGELLFFSVHSAPKVLSSGNFSSILNQFNLINSRTLKTSSLP